MKGIRRAALGIATVAIVASCTASDEANDRETPSGAGEITVAAASNFRDVFDELGSVFTAETGISVTFVYGSSGLLREQIINGAPYDVFASASSEFIDDVVEAGIGDDESSRTFALGRLALWTNDSRTVPTTIDDVELSMYRRIVIANPETAPYGQAARDVLEDRGLWSAVEDRLVLAENIGDAFRIVQSGDADIGLIALSLIITRDTEYLVIPAEMHRPLDHTVVVLSSSPRGQAGQEFVEFMTSERGRQLLTTYGFGLPDTASASTTDNDTTTSNPTE